MMMGLLKLIQFSAFLCIIYLESGIWNIFTFIFLFSIFVFWKSFHSHPETGFNCGEAANFATPKWLHVAKEAAVRRATMNYLPMLSHQQLLYMLTMSFISR